MKFVSKILACVLTFLVFFQVFVPVQAVALPRVQLSVPSPIQAEVGRSFIIPLTIANGDFQAHIRSITPIIRDQSLTVERRLLNRVQPENSTFTTHLTGIAQTTGLFRVSLEVEAAGFLYTTDVMLDVRDPDEAARRARFRVSDVDVSSTDTEKPFTVNISLQNIGDDASGLLQANLSSQPHFTIRGLTNRVDIEEVEANATANVSFALEANENRTSNEVALTLSYGTFTQNETIILPLPDPDDEEVLLPPILKIESFELLPLANGEATLNITVLNEGSSIARNVTVSLDAGTAAFPLRGGNIRTIRELLPDAKTTIKYVLSSVGNLTAHPVNLSFDFLDEDDVRRTSTDRIFLTTLFEPLLSLSSFSATPTQNEGEFNLSLRIRNTGSSTARNITLRFTGTQALPLNKSSLIPISDLASGQQASTNVLMGTSIQSDTFTIPFEITYSSPGGAELKATDSITVNKESAGIVSEENRGLLPVMLYRHALSADAAYSGEDLTLTLFIKNTSDMATGRAKITLGEARGATGGSIFTSRDGLNAFYVESIPANGEIEQSIQLSVDRNAAAMTYTLPINIEYEDDEKEVFSLTSNVLIPVRQMGRFRILMLDLQEEVFAGDAVPLRMEFANTGRVNLENMFISLEGDFEKENATFFIPSFTQGTTDFFHATIFPHTEGVLEGVIVITYDDSNGQEIRVEQPISLNVLAQPTLTPDQNNLPPRSSFPIPMWLIIGIAVIILAIALFFIIKKMKKRQA